MALSSEDKADVKKAMGSKMADRVSRVTHDSKSKALKVKMGKKAKISLRAKPEDIGHTISDAKGNILKRHEGRGRFALK